MLFPGSPQQWRVNKNDTQELGNSVQGVGPGPEVGCSAPGSSSTKKIKKERKKEKKAQPAVFREPRRRQKVSSSPRKSRSCSRQHRRTRPGLGWQHYLCSDFLSSGEEVSGDAAAAGAEVTISALLVARIPVPSPPGGALGKACDGGQCGPWLSCHGTLQPPAFSSCFKEGPDS